MVAATLPSKLGGLARTLVQEKLLSEDEASAIQSLANSQQTPFISQLIQSKKLSAMKIAETAAEQSRHGVAEPRQHLVRRLIRPY